ncbi:MAG: M14/M99 family metallopeptidase [Candidatus Magnetoovum sp. WYHC-5]|nr:M14/M99 family metallopeptidase [Candidatus Magnetoovum sp. WYHC-5]
MKNKLSLFIVLVLVCLPVSLFADTTHQVFFNNTDYELHVYKIKGEQQGKTMMIIGGIQGDEPGGYLAADLYVDIGLKRGNLIVVPRANFLSIIKNQRAINSDMNRRFNNEQLAAANTDKAINYEDKIVDILEGLINESDFLLNLHEGSGFYSNDWLNSLVNPMRFGQSIIADADVYKKTDGSLLTLGEIANKVAEKVNPYITNKNHHFKFNNHNTFDKYTMFPEQRKSATFYALSRHEIPAFGVETSKEIKDLELKVVYQTMVINAFMDVYGILPSSPKVSLEPPVLNYLAIKINGMPHIVQNGETVAIEKGDVVKVFNIDAVYKRGLNVDIEGYGTYSDFDKEFVIEKSSKVIVKKDVFKCGQVFLEVKSAYDDGSVASSGKVSFKYLIVELNGVRQVLKAGERLEAVKGDSLKLVDVVTDWVVSDMVTVNLKGFLQVGQQDVQIKKKALGNIVKKTQDSRGVIINTAKDLEKRYSEGTNGSTYKVEVRYGNKKIANVFIALVEPKMDYLVVKQKGNGKKWYSDGDVMFVKPNEVIEIVDVKTNVVGNKGISFAINGKRAAYKVDKQNKFVLNMSEFINKDANNTKEYMLDISREGVSLGKTVIRVGEALAFNSSSKEGRN